ncbi:MAG: OmpA family protein [Flammeovirgaceae bacterium]|nr:OmpA family protein [Flammeovirgaceae bacterium]
MKKCALCILFFGSLSTVFAQNAKELPAGYYTVVAAYADTREDYAKKFTEGLINKGVKAEYGFNSSRNLYFVYLNYYSDLKSGIKDMLATRKQGTFTNAWVRVIPGIIGSTDPNLAAKPVEPVQEEKPVVAETEVKKEDPAQKTEAVTVMEEKPTEEVAQVTQVTETKPADTTQTFPDNYVEPEYQQPPIVQYPHMMLSNTEVFLSLYYGQKNRIVDGEVQVINAASNKLIKKVNGNEYLFLPDPKGTGKLILICEAFGYKKIQQELDYQNPLSDTVKPYVDLLGTTFVVYFDLQRYKKGDFGTLYNVYFFNDAAVMMPESRYELNNLLTLLQDNPNFMIKLHGHTNANYHGKIITMGPSRDFFSITSDDVTKMGSAKELSYQRAACIREWLISQGIDGSRIEIKAWGGKKPLYDKHSANARKNVRVEVEVTGD